MKTTNRPDSAPLKKMFSGVQRCRAQIAESLNQERSLQVEYENWMATTAPTDNERIALIASRKTQLDLHPAYRKRLEAELSERITALASEAATFRSALLEAFRQELESQEAEFADQLRPHFPDKVDGLTGQRTDCALNIARQSTGCQVGASRIAATEHTHWSDQPRDNNPQNWDASLLSAVEALLALAEQE